MEPVKPVQTVELFPRLSQELLAVLKILQPADWARLTICSPWTVKDVAAHLLGGNFGRLWKRDESSASSLIPDQNYDSLLRLINSDNDLWVQAAQKISPEILIELLELTDNRLYDHFRSLDLDEPARITVAWAGDNLPPNWFDIAREYTEKWLHQQHIREAVGRPLVLGRELFFPVLDTFIRGLPRAYRQVEAPDGTSMTIQIKGEAGGDWTLLRVNQTWQLFTGCDDGAVSTVQIDQDLAWRLFTRGIDRDEALSHVHIEGNASLGVQVMNLVSIMA